MGTKRTSMASIPFMGVIITLESHERDELPGVWWPRASLTVASTGAKLEPVTHHDHYGTKADADAFALRLARRRINNELHQG